MNKLKGTQAREAAVHAQVLTKVFVQGGKTLSVLNKVSLDIYPGEVVALVGASGSGKSTLLQLLGLLDTPTSGVIKIEGAPTQALSDDRRSDLRRHKIGFVYQFHHLLPSFSALENVMLPLQIKGESRAKAKEKALFLLEKLGLKARAEHRPSQLSGGEQQRIAILRALANAPALLLADEPTGNLDETTATIVLNELLALAKENKMACLIATHSPELAQKMDRILCLQTGQLIEKKP